MDEARKNNFPKYISDYMQFILFQYYLRIQHQTPDFYQLIHAFSKKKKKSDISNRNTFSRTTCWCSCSGRQLRRLLPWQCFDKWPQCCWPYLSALQRVWRRDWSNLMPTAVSYCVFESRQLAARFTEGKKVHGFQKQCVLKWGRVRQYKIAWTHIIQLMLN